jgi:hypothetical protein
MAVIDKAMVPEVINEYGQCRILNTEYLSVISAHSLTYKSKT